MLFTLAALCSVVSPGESFSHVAAVRISCAHDSNTSMRYNTTNDVRDGHPTKRIFNYKAEWLSNFEYVLLSYKTKIRNEYRLFSFFRLEDCLSSTGV